MIKMYSMEFYTDEVVSDEEYQKRVAIIAGTKPACVSPDIVDPVVHVLYRTEDERDQAVRTCLDAGLTVTARLEKALVEEKYFPVLN